MLVQLTRQDVRVTESEVGLLTLLRTFDDPEWLEWPQHCNRTETVTLFGRLTARMEARFSERSRPDTAAR